MPAPKLTIALICTVALAATVGAAYFETGRQERSGRTGLRDRAVKFMEALEDASRQHRVASLVPWLEPAEQGSSQALAALEVLGVASLQRKSLVLAQVRLAKGGQRGQAEYLLVSGDRSTPGGPILVDWIRGPDGTWFLDLVGS